MNKTKPKSIDKTKLFQALEKELLESGNQSVGLNFELDRAISDLSNYFENTDILKQSLNIGGLTYEHAFLQGKAGVEWVHKNVIVLLTEFRLARVLDSERLWNLWTQKLQATHTAINNSAAISTLATRSDRNDLDLYLQVKTHFRDIGELLEGSLQPFVRLLLSLNAI